jgi:hypothetical protein
VIFLHALNGKVFHAQHIRLAFANEMMGYFMQEITTLIGNVFVELCKLFAKLGLIVASFSLLRITTLKTGKTLFGGS